MFCILLGFLLHLGHIHHIGRCEMALDDFSIFHEFYGHVGRIRWHLVAHCIRAR